MKSRIKFKVLSLFLGAVLLLQSCSWFTDETDIESESFGSQTTTIYSSTDDGSSIDPTIITESETTIDETTEQSSSTTETRGSESSTSSDSQSSAEPSLAASLFYVRDAWDKPDTQSGAFADYDNAVTQADLMGQSVFDEDGNLLYEGESLPTVTVTPTTVAPTTTAPTTAPSTTVPTTTVPSSTVLPTTVPTTPPTTTAPPSGNYSQISNASEGWYYTPGSPEYADVPAAIDSRRAGLLAKYNAIWQLPVQGRKVVYLTMDEGYEYGSNTTEILNVARDKNAKITFFVTGHYVDSQPALVRRMVNEGHQVANHTDKHLVQPDALNTSVATLQRDINDVNAKFKNLTGRNLAPYMRPPTGAWSERSLAVTRDMGYRAVFWSFAYRDWEVDNQPSYDAAYNTIMSQLYPGSIILIHAVSTTNTAILGRVIDGIRARGYSIELLP